MYTPSMSVKQISADQLHHPETFACVLELRSNPSRRLGWSKHSLHANYSFNGGKQQRALKHQRSQQGNWSRGPFAMIDACSGWSKFEKLETGVTTHPQYMPANHQAIVSALLNTIPLLHWLSKLTCARPKEDAQTMLQLCYPMPVEGPMLDCLHCNSFLYLLRWHADCHSHCGGRASRSTCLAPSVLIAH